MTARRKWPAEKTINQGRHEAQCSVCKHAQREEIEADFIAWRSPAAIAKEYDLAESASVYRHAHALGLFSKRQRNVRAALERIIEKAGKVEPTAAAIVAAIRSIPPVAAR